MFTRIAVPLDGSALAEQALPVAVNLARRLEAGLVLLRVIEEPPLASQPVGQSLEETDAARAYMVGVRKRLLSLPRGQPLEPEKVLCRVIYAEKARNLARLAASEQCGLLVMTTHGRSGLSRLIMGSVAASVIKNSDIPVVLLRPDDQLSGHPAFCDFDRAALALDLNHPLRLVVALDGSPEAEASLKPASELARQLDAMIYLLKVIPPDDPAEAAGRWSTENQIRQHEDEAFHYLGWVQTELDKHGLKSVKVVRTGRPVREIVDFISIYQPTLLLMATHPRNRLEQTVQSSTAEDVLTRSSQPVLMVRC